MNISINSVKRMTNNQNQFVRNLTFWSGTRKILLSIKKILNNLGEEIEVGREKGGGVVNHHYYIWFFSFRYFGEGKDLTRRSKNCQTHRLIGLHSITHNAYTGRDLDFKLQWLSLPHHPPPPAPPSPPPTKI